MAAHAEETANTNEFIQLLKNNAAEKAKGINDQKQFFLKLEKLADKGNPSAQFLLGGVFLKSRRDIAEKYFSASAKAGCAGAETGLGILAMINKKTETGVKYFKAAAKKGDATAQVAISGLLQRGEGLHKSLPKAYAWLLMAERQTYSNGTLRAIHDGMNKLQNSMAKEDIVNAKKYFSKLREEIPKVSYHFCGQLNIDTSRDPNVPYYYKF